MNARTRGIVFALLVSAGSVLVVFLIYYYLKRVVPSPADATGIDWYLRKVDQWELQARILRTAQVLLAVVAIASSVLAAADWKPRGVPTGFLAVVAAISIALLTGLDLTPQANKIRNATRHLTLSILKYRQASSTTLEDVRTAYKEAEELVGDYSPKVGPE